jgi:hypothetical protein
VKNDVDVGLRPEADRPVETRVRLVRARLSPNLCSHGLPLWAIDDEHWHVVAREREQPILMACEVRP